VSNSTNPFSLMESETVKAVGVELGAEVLSQEAGETVMEFTFGIKATGQTSGLKGQGVQP